MRRKYGTQKANALAKKIADLFPKDSNIADEEWLSRVYRLIQLRSTFGEVKHGTRFVVDGPALAQQIERTFDTRVPDDPYECVCPLQAGYFGMNVDVDN